MTQSSKCSSNVVATSTGHSATFSAKNPAFHHHHHQEHQAEPSLDPNSTIPPVPHHLSAQQANAPPKTTTTTTTKTAIPKHHVLLNVDAGGDGGFTPSPENISVEFSRTLQWELHFAMIGTISYPCDCGSVQTSLGIAVKLANSNHSPTLKEQIVVSVSNRTNHPLLPRAQLRPRPRRLIREMSRQNSDGADGSLKVGIWPLSVSSVLGSVFTFFFFFSYFLFFSVFTAWADISIPVQFFSDLMLTRHE